MVDYGLLLFCFFSIRAKAFYRRGLAEGLVQEEEESLKDLTEAHQLTPDEVVIKKELEATRLRIEARRKKERAAFGKMFG